MKIGDRVTWTSQSGGYQKTKTGMIVAVVPAEINPEYHIPRGCRLRYPVFERDHESYLVKVTNQSYLYWPRVSGLKLVDAPDSTAVLQQIHQIAEAQTFRGHCSDDCRERWSEVCRLARDAAAGVESLPKDSHDPRD
jgi:hypothetical protein